MTVFFYPSPLTRTLRQVLPRSASRGRLTKGRASSHGLWTISLGTISTDLRATTVRCSRRTARGQPRQRGSHRKARTLPTRRKDGSTLIIWSTPCGSETRSPRALVMTDLEVSMLHLLRRVRPRPLSCRMCRRIRRLKQERTRRSLMLGHLLMVPQRQMRVVD